MKIGIITLHKVVNYGSALQAYALQHYLEKEYDAEVELIDYKFPNCYHKRKRTLKEIIRYGISQCIEYSFRHRSREISLFKDFYNKYFNLSSKYYQSIEQIEKDSPVYDIYMTGSDQVWNVETLRNDPVMYCRFAPKDAIKISFSSSFALKSVPVEYEDSIQKYLSSYSFIGVREKSGLDILEKLSLPDNIVKECTCDPTLLLDADDYDKIAHDSSVKLEGDYILAYYLCYAYNPEPAFSKTIEKLYKQHKCKVVIIGRNSFSYSGKYKKINGIGPSEFVWLIKHAKAVVTSSFHGTMFSLIYRKALYAIVPPKCGKDSRISDVLEIIGLEKSIIHSDSVINNSLDTQPYSDLVNKRLGNYILKSKCFISKSLEDKGEL